MVPIKKRKKNDKPSRQNRLLAGAIVLGLCLGWGDSPAYAATTTVVAGTSENDVILGAGEEQLVFGTVNNTTLNANGRQGIYGNGAANATVLNDKALQEVYDSGTANNTVMNDSALQQVYDNGTVKDTTLNDSTVQEVSGNGTANRTTLNNSAAQWVHETGTANDTILNNMAVQYVYGSGTVNDTILNNSARQWVYETGTANSTTLGDNAVQRIYGNGTVNGTVLNASAHQEVFGSGMANDTAVNDSATQWGLQTGAANGTILNDNALQRVYDSGAASGTTLNGGAEQYIYGNGFTTDTVLNDNTVQEVYDSGIANNTTLNVNAKQYVYGSGVVNDTVLRDSARQAVYGSGTAHGTVLNDNAEQRVFDGGTVQDTELNGNALQEVYGTGAAHATTLKDSAAQLVYGSGKANNTMLNDSTKQYVYDNGVINDTVLSDSALQEVFGSGEAYRTTLNHSTRQAVYGRGTANGTMLNDSALQVVFENGTAWDTVLSGNARQEVYDTGEVRDTTLQDNAVQLVYGNGVARNTALNGSTVQRVYGSGTANGTVLRDGSLQWVYGDSDAYRTEVNDNAAMVVESGAAAYDTTVNGGILFIRQNSVLTNDEAVFGAAIRINSGGTLAVMEDATVVDGNVAMQEGSIAFLRQGAGYTHDAGGLTLIAGDGYKTLTINGDLSGGGQLAMSTNITEGTSDRLIVTGNATGAYQVGFTNDATAAANGSETVQDVIQTGGGTGVFSGEVEYGGYVYELKQDENGYWDLAGSKKISSSGSASFGTFSAGYLLNYAETTALHQRLGDLRRGEALDAPWARVYGGRFSTGSGLVSGYGMSYRGIQIGLDHKRESRRGTAYTGGMIGYTSSSQSYNRGSGSTDSTALGLYQTYINPEGRYIDLVVKYGWMSSDYKVRDTAQAWVDGDLSTRGPSLSLEVGQRLYGDKVNGQGWYLEPQAQLSLGRQGGGSFTASNGLAVKVDDYSSVLGRVGLIIGREIRQGTRSVNTYGKVSYVKEFDGDIGFSLNGSPVREKLGGSWWSYGAGVAAQLGNDNSLYLDATRASGGKCRQSWQLNVGLRGQFN